MWNRIRKLSSSYAFNIALIAGTAVLVLWITLRNNQEDVWTMLTASDPVWIAALITSVIVNRILTGWAIHCETRLTYPEYSFGQGIVNAFVGGFFNGITPGASGGQFAQVYLFRRQGVDISDSASVLWMDFILYQSTIVITVTALVLLKLKMFVTGYSGFFLIAFFGYAVNAGMIVLLFAMNRSPRFYHWLSTAGVRAGVKLHLVKDPEKARKSLEMQLDRFRKEVEHLSQHRRMIVAVCATHFIRLMLYYSMPWMAANALHVTAEKAGFLNDMALTSFVTMINAFIPLPGSSGGTEAAFLLMFSTVYGMRDASAIMILWRFMSYYLDLMIGGAVFLVSRVLPARRLERIKNRNEVNQ